MSSTHLTPRHAAAGANCGAARFDFTAITASLPPTRDCTPDPTGASDLVLLRAPVMAGLAPSLSRAELTVDVNHGDERRQFERSDGDAESPSFQRGADVDVPQLLSIVQPPYNCDVEPCEAIERAANEVDHEHHVDDDDGTSTTTSVQRHRQAHSRRMRINTIIPDFLYLSGRRAAHARDVTRAHGINAFLCVAKGETLPDDARSPRSDASSGDGAERDDVIMCHVPMTDDGRTELHEHFSECFAFLRRCEAEGRRVLVYCREGKSRSASIVIAYLIRFRGLEYAEALDFVRAARDEVDPNFAFCSQLDSYSEVQKQIRQSRGNNSSNLAVVSLLPEPALPPSGSGSGPLQQLNTSALSGGDESFGSSFEPRLLLSPESLRALAQSTLPDVRPRRDSGLIPLVNATTPPPH